MVDLLVQRPLGQRLLQVVKQAVRVESRPAGSRAIEKILLHLRRWQDSSLEKPIRLKLWCGCAKVSIRPDDETWWLKGSAVSGADERLHPAVSPLRRCSCALRQVNRPRRRKRGIFAANPGVLSALPVSALQTAIARSPTR